MNPPPHHLFQPSGPPPAVFFASPPMPTPEMFVEQAQKLEDMIWQAVATCGILIDEPQPA